MNLTDFFKSGYYIFSISGFPITMDNLIIVRFRVHSKYGHERARLKEEVHRNVWSDFFRINKQTLRCASPQPLTCRDSAFSEEDRCPLHHQMSSLA